MRIYLTGFMASGKSTVGPRVAERLGLRFVDLDAAIEARADRSIPAIFEAHGEAAFRAIEREVLHETAQQDDFIVALGGGALADPENLAFAKAHGTVVYLRVPVDDLLQRLAREADKRPLLQDEAGTPLSTPAMRTRIAAMLDDRRRFYEQAHVTIDAAQPVKNVVEALADLLDARRS